MNQRINELVGQAKFMAEETLNKQISANAELNAFAEKFAELIVGKCVDIADEYDGVGSTIVNRIKEHFGVEP